jgi:hypothetical protein
MLNQRKNSREKKDSTGHRFSSINHPKCSWKIMKIARIVKKSNLELKDLSLGFRIF